MLCAKEAEWGQLCCRGPAHFLPEARALLLHVLPRGAGSLQSPARVLRPRASCGTQGAVSFLPWLFIPGYPCWVFYTLSVPYTPPGYPGTLLQGLPSSGL